MKILVSPAKTLDFETDPLSKKYSQPGLLEHSSELIDQLRELAPQQISELMKISDKLGVLNYERFQEWQLPFTDKNAKPAVEAFKGDVYTGLAVENFSDEDFDQAQSQLRILSGLYGLLKPLDLIQPYRLEMGTKFENSRGKNLYNFWGDIITDQLNDELENGEPIINLASNEYFKSIKKKNIKAPIFTPSFKDWKNGQYKMISFYAKKARGLMAAYIIQNRIENVEDIKKFDVAGYYFSEEQSSANDWVFLRDEPQ